MVVEFVAKAGFSMSSMKKYGGVVVVLNVPDSDLPVMPTNTARNRQIEPVSVAIISVERFHDSVSSAENRLSYLPALDAQSSMGRAHRRARAFWSAKLEASAASPQLRRWISQIHRPRRRGRLRRRDAGKRIKGYKHHFLVDTLGLAREWR